MAEKILIIDDDLDTLRLVGMLLQKQGYKIIAATNGPQGITQAEAEKPDLILLDIMMPDMDGYEVARRLRANPVTLDTPIIMFTAKTQLDDKVSGFEAGADDYLTKPTHPTELTAHVKALLARSVKARPISQPISDIKAYTIGILAARGGLGVTTVALNLGSALLAATGKDVIVAELRPGQGTLGPDFGEAEPHGLVDLLKSSSAELTRPKVKDALYTMVPSNLRILMGSTKPSDASLLNDIPPFELLVGRMVFMASYLLMDLGPGLPSLSQKLLKSCNHILLALEPVASTIQHTRQLIADLEALGINRRNISAVVVNRIRSDMQLNWTQVQERLDHPVPVAVTPAPELIYQATRVKASVVAHLPDSLTSQQFGKLASLMVERSKQVE